MTTRGTDNLERADGPEKFEEMLTEQMTAVLEPQRGRALAAFRAQVAAEGSTERPVIAGTIKRELRAGRGGQISRRELWFWTGVPSLAAACLAVVVTLQLMKPRVEVTPAAGGGTIVVNNSPKADQVVVTQRATGGVVVSNNVPMQEVREKTINQYQWVDPKDNATYRLIQPTEKVDFIQVKPD